MKKIILVNSEENYDREKAAIAHVVVIVKSEAAHVIKDRQNRAYDVCFLSKYLNEFIAAVYPDYEIEDCRA